MMMQNWSMIRPRLIFFLAFSKLLTKRKKNFGQNHTTIVRDEYKIEDLMNEVRRLCQPGKRILLQDIFEEAKDVNELITVFWQLWS